MRCLRSTYEFNGDNIVCNLCPHECSLPNGVSGKCRVREHGTRNGIKGLFLTNYSQAVCVKIDTLAQRPVYDYYSNNCKGRDTKSLTVGLTGCNNFCPFCQNYEISQNKKFDKSFKFTPKDIVHNAIINNVRCISLTFSEPIVWIEYLLDLFHESEKYSIPSRTEYDVRLKKFDIVLKTAGYINPFHTPKIVNAVDAINLDIKPLNDQYLKKCGIEDNRFVEQFLKYAYNKVHVEISHIVIEGVNDDKEEILKFGEKVLEYASGKISIHLLRHYPAWKSNYPVTRDSVMERSKEVLVKLGFSNVYTEKIQ